MAGSAFILISYLIVYLFSTKAVRCTSPFLQNTPGLEWRMIGSLDMTDTTQQCPDSWKKISSPRPSCGMKSNAPCDSLNIPTGGATYQTICGRFRGYEVGSTDGFYKFNDNISTSIETYYVDGVTVTYGPPGKRRHVFTYASGVFESNGLTSCPCARGAGPPSFVGSDYYCESGNPGTSYYGTQVFYSDLLWDGQQCGGDESTCCNSPNLPWFCKTFPTPINEDIEIRICTDEDIDSENVAIEFFELYIQANIKPVTSFDIFGAVGITIGVSFVVFFFLGVVITSIIGCVLKKKSGGPPPSKPTSQPVVSETNGHSVEMTTETNCAYDTVYY